MEERTVKQQDIEFRLYEIDVTTRDVRNLLHQLKDISNEELGALRRVERLLGSIETYAGVCAIGAGFYIFATVRPWFN
jgi:hypothetical protein